MKFEIYKDKSKQWRWRLKARNGKIIATGESYKTRRAAEKCVQSIRLEAVLASTRVFDKKKKD